MSSSSELRRSHVLRAGTAPARAHALLGVELHDVHEERVVSRAVTEAREAAWAAGFEAGRADGYEAGLAAAGDDIARAEARRTAEVQHAVATLAAAAAAWAEREHAALSLVEDAIIDGALAIAEAVIGRELAVAGDPGADALARALRLAPSGADVVARLHPEDGALLGHVDARVTVIADPAIAPGGCVVEAGAASIDAQLETALARVREVLGR